MRAEQSAGADFKQQPAANSPASQFPLRLCLLGNGNELTPGGVIDAGMRPRWRRDEISIQQRLVFSS